jgi:hypothetical protein
VKPQQDPIEGMGRCNLLGAVAGIDNPVDELIDRLVGDSDDIAGARCRRRA